MAYSSTTPYLTPKYHIEVPTHQVYIREASPYKVWFGSKFYIGKGKSIVQSVESMATYIERALRTGKNDDTSLYYHIVAYVKRARIIKGRVELISDESFIGREAELLILEQTLLDKHKDDPNLLNNSFDAYIPKWIPAEQAELFIQWKNERDAANKAKRNKNRPANKHKAKPKRTVAPKGK